MNLLLLVLMFGAERDVRVALALAEAASFPRQPIVLAQAMVSVVETHSYAAAYEASQRDGRTILLLVGGTDEANRETKHRAERENRHFACEPSGFKGLADGIHYYSAPMRSDETLPVVNGGVDPWIEPPLVRNKAPLGGASFRFRGAEICVGVS